MTVTECNQQAVTNSLQYAHIVDSVRGISKCVESLIDSQINLICALLETVSQGCSGTVTRALIGISGAVLAA